MAKLGWIIAGALALAVVVGAAAPPQDDAVVRRLDELRLIMGRGTHGNVYRHPLLERCDFGLVAGKASEASFCDTAEGHRPEIDRHFVNGTLLGVPKTEKEKVLKFYGPFMSKQERLKYEGLKDEQK